MTTPTGSLMPDTLVHGRYRVARQIGRGGMGAVYVPFAFDFDDANNLYVVTNAPRVLTFAAADPQ